MLITEWQQEQSGKSLIAQCIFLSALYSQLKHHRSPSGWTHVTECKAKSPVYSLSYRSVCRHSVGHWIPDGLLTVTVTCGYFCPPPSVLGKYTCWTISTAAALLPSQYSRKYLLFTEPGSSLAAVVYYQCMLVVFDSSTHLSAALCDRVC